MTSPDPLQLAIEHHEAGRLERAEHAYRQIVADNPRDPDALYLLGLLSGQSGRNEIAVDFIGRAIAIDPGVAEYLCNFGEFSRRVGKLDQAIDACSKAIALDPNCVEAHFNLGAALSDKQEIEQAIAAYNRAADLSPQSVPIISALAFALRKAGHCDRAIDTFKKLIQLNEKSPDAWLALAGCLRDAERFDESIDAYRKGINVNPGNAEAHNNLANLLKQKMQLEQAVEHYQKALLLKPSLVQTRTNLAAVLRDLDRLDEAVSHSRTAISLDPDFVDAYIILAVCLKDQRELDQSIATHTKALELSPSNAVPDSSRLYIMHLHPAYDPAALLHEHRAWSDRHARPLRDQIQPHTIDRSPNRQLRLGFVSPDFYYHPVGRFLLPLFENLNRTQFQIVCYSDVERDDSITERIRKSTDAWHNIRPMDDASLATKIRDDKIDILIDLTLHSAHNRLLTFAQARPIQVTWLGYPGTTGLDTIDYRISDPYLDRIGSDANYSETTLRLPHCFWCYQSFDPSIEVSPLPALKSGFITFGCFNNFCKISSETQRTWAELMNKIPNSRILIYSKPGSHAEKLRQQFGSAGIAPSRIEFLRKAPERDYLRQHHLIDIALDPFPYGGGATTCDALWMGIPTITLTGQTPVGRGGTSLLSNIGLQEWIATTKEQYVDLAVSKANDLLALAQLRSRLRGYMESSPVMNAPQFARDMENAYRQMWRQWCLNG